MLNEDRLLPETTKIMNDDHYRKEVSFGAGDCGLGSRPKWKVSREHHLANHRPDKQTWPWLKHLLAVIFTVAPDTLFAHTHTVPVFYIAGMMKETSSLQVEDSAACTKNSLRANHRPGLDLRNCKK